MHRFFITSEDEILDRSFVVRCDDLVHQWSKVLRFGVGEKVVLLDNSGDEFVGEILEFGKKEIVGNVLEKRKGEGELPVKIILAQGFLKNVDKFEWVLQKGTELGISAFVPLQTERTERKIFEKRERWEKILKEAAEQSGRAKIPVLLESYALAKVLEKKSFVIVPHPTAIQTFSEFQKNLKTLPEEIFICIGPEGGFSEGEMELAHNKKAHIVSLGKRVLRSETAGLVVATLVNQWAGQL